MLFYVHDFLLLLTLSFFFFISFSFSLFILSFFPLFFPGHVLPLSFYPSFAVSTPLFALLGFDLHFGLNALKWTQCIKLDCKNEPRCQNALRYMARYGIILQMVCRGSTGAILIVSIESNVRPCHVVKILEVGRSSSCQRN